MIIALTGTPGTGKTSVCGSIAEQYRKQYRIIDLNRLVIDEKLYTGKDVKRDSYEADLGNLEKRVEQLISQTPQGQDIIMEGHLSHYLPVDAVIVLRAHPAVLRKRLGRRKEYSFDKIKENANAEALDVILVESVEQNRNVFEIDTTDMDMPAVVKSVVSIVDTLKKGKLPDEFLPGKVNWIDLIEL